MTIASLRTIRPGDTWVLDALGRIVGVQDANGSGRQMFAFASVDANTGAVSLKVEGASDTFQVQATATAEAQNGIPLNGPKTLAKEDDNKTYYCTTQLTVTIPAGLSPQPSVVILPPPTGNLTIAVTGGAKINDATASLTRTRANNPLGVAIKPWPDVTDGYGGSGI